MLLFFSADIVWPDSADYTGPKLEDVVSITISEGPSEKQRKEMDTLAMIWAAGIARQDLDVTLRNINRLG